MRFLVFVPILWGAAGCYAHHGAPVHATSDEWVAMADNACTRHDVIGAKTLLEHAARVATPEERPAIEVRVSAPCGEEHP